MEIKMLSRVGVVAIALGGAVGAAAAADESGYSGFVSLGLAFTPEYEGADEYQVVPAPAGRLDAERFSLELQGTKLSADIAPALIGRTGLSFGPVASYRFAREDLDDDAVDRLDDVDAAFEIGGMIGYSAPVGLAAGDQASIGLDVLFDVTDAHGGVVADASAGYSFQASQRLRLGAGVSASFADEEYMDTYFSVTNAGAAASGLGPFDADAGLRSVGAQLNGQYAIGPNWGVVGVASYSRMVGDAADSPIVGDAGSENQFFGTVGVFYRF